MLFGSIYVLFVLCKPGVFSKPLPVNPPLVLWHLYYLSFHFCQ